MDPITNPYSPGAGAPPPELVGRHPLLDETEILLARLRAGRPEKSVLYTGLRGVGKTVLLNEVERRARKQGVRTLFVEAHENKSLGPLLAPYLRSLLFEMNRMSGIAQTVNRALSVLGSFVRSLKLSYHDVSISVDVEPEMGVADSGDLEIDLPELFVAIGEAAQDRQCAVAILIDEVQYLTRQELGALIMAMHKLQQRGLPVALLGAGLPILPGLAGESKSYAERLFSFPDVGALSSEDAARALCEPARNQGVEFELAAVEEIYRMTQGYPYFVQEWGYLAWNVAQRSPITLADVRRATPRVIERLDQNFFRVRFDRLAPTEKSFLRGMAELGPGVHRTGDIAMALRVKPTSLSPTRAKLVRKGMIYSPSYGELAFTVPLFDEFMRRAMP